MKKFMYGANSTWKVLSAIAFVFMLINVGVIIANIVMRRFFDMPIVGSTEIIRYISLCAASFALAQNEWVDGNVTMTIAHEHMSKTAGERLKFFTNLICAIVFVLISSLLINQGIQKFVLDDVSYELSFPVWIPAMILAVSFCILTAAIIIKTILIGHSTFKTGEVIVFRELVIESKADDLLQK